MKGNYIASIVNLSTATENLYWMVIADKTHISAPDDDPMMQQEKTIEQSLAAEQVLARSIQGSQGA